MNTYRAHTDTFDQFISFYETSSLGFCFLLFFGLFFDMQIFFPTPHKRTKFDTDI